jgi:hypothetical protein
LYAWEVGDNANKNETEPHGCYTIFQKAFTAYILERIYSLEGIGLTKQVSLSFHSGFAMKLG